MATDLDNATTARSAVITELAANTGKPDYSIDGQGVQWGARRTQLMAELEKWNEIIRILGGPFEAVMMGVTT